jgi:hypothetical protein
LISDDPRGDDGHFDSQAEKPTPGDQAPPSSEAVEATSALEHAAEPAAPAADTTPVSAEQEPSRWAADSNVTTAASGHAARVSAPGKVADPRRRRRRRVGGGLVSTLVAVAAAVYFVPGLRENVPAAVPVVGKNADTVFKQLQQDGLPVTHGEPASTEFRDMVHNNACRSSKAFVRSDADQGWGFICVGSPEGTRQRISDAFTDLPVLMGPLYVDDDGGDTIIVGLGWPGNASKMVAEAINADGTYLLEP